MTSGEVDGLPQLGLMLGISQDICQLSSNQKDKCYGRKVGLQRRVSSGKRSGLGVGSGIVVARQISGNLKRRSKKSGREGCGLLRQHSLLGDMVAVCGVSRDDNGGTMLPQGRISTPRSNTFISNCHE